MPDRRRQTLGPVSVNRGRKSIEGGAGAGLPKKSTRSRVSMAPRVSEGGGFSGSLHQDIKAVTPAGTPASKALSRQNRKSVGPGIPIGNETKRHSLALGLMRTDPRPISDKAFINASIKRLANYLFSSGYGQSNLSPKSLSRPSSKDFMNIITFLIHKVDPTFNDPSINGPGVKFEDEVTNTFRNLRYPLNVSKTALAAVGSPHTWPALLASLTWLIELLACDEAAPHFEERITQGDFTLSGNGIHDTTRPVLGVSQLDEITKRGERAFTQFVIQSYEFFLNGDDSQIEQCEDQLVEAFELDNMIVSTEKEGLEQLNIGLLEAIAGQANPGGALPEWEEKRESHFKDIDKFEDLIQMLKERKVISEKKAHDKAGELKKLKGELAEAEESIEQMKQIIKTQALSVDDVRRMMLERTRMEDEHVKTTNANQEYSALLLETELEAKRCVQDLESTIEDYNAKAASDLYLIPKTAKNANGRVFYARLEIHNAMGENMKALLGGVDMETMVKPHLLGLKEELVSKMLHAEQDIEHLEARFERIESARADATTNIKELDKVKIDEENVLQAKREEREAALKAFFVGVQSINTKIDCLRDPEAMEIAIARYETKYEDFEVMRVEEECEVNRKKHATAEEIHVAVAACKEYSSNVQTQLKRCASEFEAGQKSLAQLALLTRLSNCLPFSGV